MAGTAPQLNEMTLAEARNFAVDFGSMLDAGELLTGTPTVTGDASLTITNKQVSAAELTINGSTVAIGEAVQFKIDADTAGYYTVTITCATDASQTLEGRIRIRVSS